jgi:hypothetical protein
MELGGHRRFLHGRHNRISNPRIVLISNQRFPIRLARSAVRRAARTKALTVTDTSLKATRQR